MNSRGITPAGRVRGFVDGTVAIAVVAFVVATGGCASTETHVRVVSRAGALRERAILPAAPDHVRIAVGPEALDDTELAAAEAAVQLRQRATLDDVARTPSASGEGAARAGSAQLLRASAAVVLGRDVHRHSAKCRVRVVVDGDVVADAEAEALRTVPVRNRSAWELDGVRQEMLAHRGRNPLIARDDVVTVVDAACGAALRAVTIDARPEDAIVPDPRDPDAPPATSPALRASAAHARRDRALAALRDPSANANARAAALVDLVDTGVVDDARVVGLLLRDPDARVRRAADVAFAALCAGHTTLAPSASETCRRPEPPPTALAPTVPSATSPAPTAPLPTRPVAGVDDDDNDKEDDKQDDKQDDD